MTYRNNFTPRVIVISLGLIFGGKEEVGGLDDCEPKAVVGFVGAEGRRDEEEEDVDEFMD
uniref:Uncharacterized protein n=1 Tax=viral metagenome TaxID=1070528 RepID=A0A6M3IGZ9_9ZZZZ